MTHADRLCGGSDKGRSVTYSSLSRLSALLGFEQRRARVLGVRGRAGAVTAIQRCGSALNVNPHFHSLVPEGVFAEQRDGSQRFVPLREPPSDVEVARLLAAVRGRIIRLVRREGGLDDGRSDPLALESPVLARIPALRPLGRVGHPCTHVHHLYVVRIEPERLTCDRNAFMAEVIGAGVGLHFTAVHELTYYRQRFGDLRGRTARMSWRLDRTGGRRLRLRERAHQRPLRAPGPRRARGRHRGPARIRRARRAQSGMLPQAEIRQLQSGAVCRIRVASV
jgi:hypothetical protein